MADGSPEHPSQGQNQTDTEGNSDVSLPGSYPTCFEKYASCRWRIGFTVTFLYSTNLCLKQTMSFALVCMTGGQGNQGNQGNSSISNGTDVYEFDWDSQTQGVLLSTSFYGAIIAPFFAGPAIRRFGAKLTIQAAVLMIAAMSCLSPLAARTSVDLLIANRVVLSFFTGFVNPSTQDLWVPWFPRNEISQVVAMAFAGYHTASIVTFAISGALCTISLDNGWPFIFYFFGIYAALSVVLCQFTIYNTPEQHAFIGKTEKNFILRERSALLTSKKEAIPWRPMLLSRGVWCYLITLVLESSIWSVYPSFLPVYFSVYLGFPYEQNGLLLSITFLCKFIFVFVWSSISSMLRKRMTTTVLNKVIFTTGKILTIAVTVGLAYVKADQKYLAYGLIILSSFFEPSDLVALTTIPVDLAPSYAYIIGAGGEISRGTGLALGPIALSNVIPDRTEEQWKNLFLIASALMAGTCIFFNIFGDAEVQPWAVSKQELKIEVQTVTKRLEDANRNAYNQETEVSKL